MRRFRDVDELKDAVGAHLGYSKWHSITQEQISQFARVTGDCQWIHIDQERSVSGPFGTTIAHGYLTLALIPKLVAEIFTVDGLSMEVNYGANKIRFPSPVPVGSRIRAGAELLSVRGTCRGVQAVTRVTIDRNGSAKPACVAETISLLVP